MKLKTFEERLAYLKIDGKIGEETFGWDRYLNQILYNQKYWKDTVRRDILVRDCGYDLGDPEHEIKGLAIVHHMNPITVEDLVQKRYDLVFNYEYLITVSDFTHKYIHFGTNDYPKPYVERKPNDTCPWKKGG